MGLTHSKTIPNHSLLLFQSKGRLFAHAQLKFFELILTKGQKGLKWITLLIGSGCLSRVYITIDINLLTPE